MSEELGDELVPWEADLEVCGMYKRFFDFEQYRRPECYGLIVERTGV